MIIVEGYVRLKSPEDLEIILERAKAQIASSKAEDACIDYTYAVDVLDPCLIRVLEKWESRDGLAAHFREPHMTVWRAALKEIDIVERVLHAHEVSDTFEV